MLLDVTGDLRRERAADQHDHEAGALGVTSRSFAEPDRAQSGLVVVALVDVHQGRVLRVERERRIEVAHRECEMGEQAEGGADWSSDHLTTTVRPSVHRRPACRSVHPITVTHGRPPARRCRSASCGSRPTTASSVRRGVRQLRVFVRLGGRHDRHTTSSRRCSSVRRSTPSRRWPNGCACSPAAGSATSGSAGQARSAVELALWDIVGKSAGTLGVATDRARPRPGRGVCVDRVPRGRAGAAGHLELARAAARPRRHQGQGPDRSGLAPPTWRRWPS